MNSDILLEIALATIKRRWRLLLLLCVVTFPIAVFIMRSMDFRYTAQIRLFALPQSSQSLLDSQASLLGGSTERTALLSGQDALVHSTRIFEAVQEVDPELRKKAMLAVGNTEMLKMLLGQFQEFMFGKEYVQTRQKWKDLEFSSFKKKISVDVDLDALSISLKYKHKNPQVALLAVKKASDALQIVNTEISRNQAAKKVEFLARKIADSRAENDRISDQITAFIRKNKVSSDPRMVEPRYKGFTAANDLVTTARLEIEQRQVALDEARKVSARLQSEIKQGLVTDREGHLKSLTDDLRQYEQGLAKLSNVDSKIRDAVKKQINNVRSKIAKEFSGSSSKMDVTSLQTLLATNEASILEQESALRGAEKQLEFGGVQFKKYERQLSDLPELSASLAKMTLVQTQQRKVLELLTQRFLEAQIESDTKLEQFYVTEEPMLNDTDKLGKFPILLSMIVGILLVMIGGIVFLDLRRGVILSKLQLARFQTPHFLGTIAYEPGLRKRKAHTVVNEIGIGFRIFHGLKKYTSDSHELRKNKVIAVTSKGAGVGKTVTALGIATANQVSGGKTLVIDADYLARNRALRNQVGETVNVIRNRHELLQNAGAVTNIASGQKKQKLTLWSLADEFHNEDDVGQFLIQDFGPLLERLRDLYDCIVIDCAPCFISSMLLIYEKADINILCFAEGKSTLSDVTQVTEVVGSSGKGEAKILSVLTMTRLKANSIAPRGTDGFYYRTTKAA